eukprot:scaffold148_cov78-Phaeocystis_antarctica.AAC.12
MLNDCHCDLGCFGAELRTYWGGLSAVVYILNSIFLCPGSDDGGCAVKYKVKNTGYWWLLLVKYLHSAHTTRPKTGSHMLRPPPSPVHSFHSQPHQGPSAHGRRASPHVAQHVLSLPTPREHGRGGSRLR